MKFAPKRRVWLDVRIRTASTEPSQLDMWEKREQGESFHFPVSKFVFFTVRLCSKQFPFEVIVWVMSGPWYSAFGCANNMITSVDASQLKLKLRLTQHIIM